MIGKFVTGAALSLAVAGVASAQGLGTAATYARAQRMSISTSSPTNVGEFARTSRIEVINSTPDWNSVAFSRRGTGYALPYTPQEIAPSPGGQ